MYHIKKDKRCITSAKQIAKGLENLLEEKSLDSITVTELISKSDVGRATFYRIFDSIEDVPVYMCDLIFDDIMKDVMVKKKVHVSREEAAVIFTEKWFSHKRLAQALIRSNRIYILQESSQRFVKKMLSNIYRDNNFPVINLDYMSSALSAMFITWILADNDLSPRDFLYKLSSIVKDLSTLFPEPENEIDEQ